MKRFSFLSLIAAFMMVLGANAQNNTYNMVIEMSNGTKINIGPNDVKNIFFTDGKLTVNGESIDALKEIVEILKRQMAGFAECKCDPQKTENAIASLKEDIAKINITELLSLINVLQMQIKSLSEEVAKLKTNGNNQGGDNNQSGDENQGETNGKDAVDLGLPSGTKWASVNIGASKQEEKGAVYVWGKCEEAIATWGGQWEMPTRDDFIELKSNCSKQQISVNGIRGWKFTGPNGNSIFLPGDYVGYWSSTLSPTNSNNAVVLYIDGKGPEFTAWELSRNSNVYIRPVIGHKTPDEKPSSELNELLLVDKWTCYYQSWTDEDGPEEHSYSSNEYYIVLSDEHTGVICSGRDELFETGTNGKEKPFVWSTTGKKILVDDGSGSSEWEVISLSESELTIRWVGGDHGEYVIVGKFTRG